MGDRAADLRDGMLCLDHPYRSNPGGVCAFCLQEKLGKLVSSSKSTNFLPLQHPPSTSSSSSSPTASRADLAGGEVVGHDGAAAGRGTKFHFLAAGHIENEKSDSKLVAGGTTRATAPVAVAKNGGRLGLKRSKSVAPRRIGSSLAQVGDGGGRSNGETAAAVADSLRKKSFWSFLYHSSVFSASTSSSAANGNINRRRSTSSSSGGVCDGDPTKQQPPPPPPALDKLEATHGTPIQLGQNGGGKDSPSGVQASSSFGRKVVRSRSVGCGSRSFSGDFLERISTGLGDCTLRRVESQREAKLKSTLHIDTDGDPHRLRMKERVKCGGLFGGFGMMSFYWLSAAAAAPDEDFDGGLRTSASTPGGRAGVTPRRRTRSWGLAFPSPMRAFRSYTSTSRSTSKLISSINASNKLVNGAAPFLSVRS
ncbi:uncharacterized protein LOC122045780 [Zingiber officinale]|uniref:Uncharacterized protein n=1 Tax=Zingiber officinale TaxID=94328 RepID=A0A8J5HA53_ZINOF|nr:uncharacterized protein LOC122045780 [Zingiber officinale]KAG6524170.1 hypothetical protein ZIOFF_014061 [Zingiber officinale]